MIDRHIAFPFNVGHMAKLCHYSQRVEQLCSIFWNLQTTIVSINIHHGNVFVNFHTTYGYNIYKKNIQLQYAAINQH